MWRSIRDDAEARGSDGEGALAWARMVDDTGGDDPAKAAALVLRLLDAKPEDVHGRFHWIDGGLQTPRFTW